MTYFMVLILFAVLAFIFSKHVREEVKVICHETNEIWKACKNAEVFQSGYSAPLWLSVGSQFFVGSWHTLMHNVIREFAKQPEVEYERELLRLSDGGTVALDWALNTKSINGQKSQAPSIFDDSYPIVFVHHGLCGSSKSHYVVSLVDYLVQQGKYRVVCLVARGCGDVPLTTPQGFIASRTMDMREALQSIRARYSAPVFGVGYSLGAGLMAKYIGEEGKNCILTCACVISPCWDFMKRSPWFKIWSEKFLAQSLIEYTKKNIHVFRDNSQIELEKALSAKHVHEYDAAAVVPIHGFRDVDHYYSSSSPIHFAHNISIPTLAISADDDPVCSIDGCPEGPHMFGEGLVIARTRRGGHVSWAEGLIARESWMDRAITTWIDSCHYHYVESVRVKADSHRSISGIFRGSDLGTTTAALTQSLNVESIEFRSESQIKVNASAISPENKSTFMWSNKPSLLFMGSAIGYLGFRIVRNRKLL